ATLIKKSRPMCQMLTAPAIAAIAVRNVTSAVASLKSDSPSRMVTIRLGRPVRRAIAVAATASGGATTAPSAIAMGNEIGSTHHATTATPNVVKMTRPTDSSVMGRLLARKSTSDVRIAAV